MEMMQGLNLDVAQARTAGEFFTVVKRFTEELGFQTFSAFVVVDRPNEESQFQGIDNAPPGYDQIHDDRAEARVDPVMQYCKRAAAPILWDQETYVKAGQGKVWEAQARHGYKTGIAVALHLAAGRHFVMGIDRDKPIPLRPGRTLRLVSTIEGFVMHAQDTAFRLFESHRPTAAYSPLNAKELESPSLGR